MIELNDLPLEVCLKIFELLDIQTILICRLVCKKWKSIANQVKIEELVLDGQISKKDCYYFTNLPKRNVIQITNQNPELNLIKSTIFNLKNLKHLMLYLPIDFNKFKIKNLNKFNKLEQLEIGNYNGIGDKLCDLINLKVLCLNAVYNDLRIENLPKLSVLSCLIGLKKIDLEQTHSIIRLNLHSFDEKIFSFINLEHLFVDHTDGLVLNILQKLPKLKEIRFNLQEYHEESYDYTFGTIRSLLNEKKDLNRSLKIYFKDHLIVDHDQINNYDVADFFDYFSDAEESETDDSEAYVYYDDYGDEYDYLSDPN